MKCIAVVHNLFFLCFLHFFLVYSPNLLTDHHVLPPENGYSNTLEQFLRQYKRPFTVGCIGRAANIIGFDIAKRFKHATFVLINEEANSDTLQKCFKENPDNIVFLPKLLSIGKLQMLSECEHLDVVIAQNIDQYKDDWRKALNAVLNAGDYAFITLPNSQEDWSVQAKNFLVSLGDRVQGSFQTGQSKTFLVKTKKSYLQRKWWGHQKIQEPKSYEVISNFEKKMVHKRRKVNKINPWVHGINLTTFYMLSGKYPSRDTIVKALMALKNIPHNSASMTNIVIQGNTVKYIDFDSKKKGVSNKINAVIAAFKGEKIAYNSPKEKGSIRYTYPDKQVKPLTTKQACLNFSLSPALKRRCLKCIINHAHVQNELN